MDIFALQCFLFLGETGSFTETAKRVNRTQSAVTQQISKLEKTLGKQLCKRGSPIALTRDGEMLLSYAQRICGLYSEVLDRFTHPELEGEISFGLPEDFATKFLSDILVDFNRIYPRILLNVECDLTVNLYHRFKRGTFDMVLVKMTNPNDFPNGVEIWSEPLEWVYGSSRNKIVDASTLPLVLSPEPCVYRARALQALENAGRRWRTAFISTSYVGTIAAVKAGMGLTVLPSTMIPDFLSVCDEMKFLSLPDIHVSLLKQTNENPSLNILEEFLLARIYKQKSNKKLV